MDHQPTRAKSDVSPAAIIPSQEGGEEGHGSFAQPGQSSSASLTENLSQGGSGVGQGTLVPQDHSSNADPATVAEIREQWRRRQAWHRAEKSLTLQAKGLCRRLVGGDIKEAAKLYDAAKGKGEHPLAHIALAAIFPLTEARDGVERHRKLVERRLEKLAKTLPVAPWVVSIRGVGLASLAAIVGEAGDLSTYSTPAKLWKRLGLAVMPDGTRQRRIGGADAIAHGYSPQRRSVVWNIGACIVKAGGPLKEAYDARKLIELERVETRGHAHNRAQRYIEKRFAALGSKRTNPGGAAQRRPSRGWPRFARLG